MSARALLVALLPDCGDDDILDYLVGTVEQLLEDGEPLEDSLPELLVSYELAEDEDAAKAICGSLAAQLTDATPAAPPASEPVKVLSTPVQMGDGGTHKEDLSAMFGQATMDEFGNSISAAAKANFASHSKSQAAAAAAAGAKAVEEDEEAAGNFGFHTGGLCTVGPVVGLEPSANSAS